MKELVSVVVPVYNAEDFLAECVDSIINQDYSELEIILINDGSKDDSLKICQNYMAKDNRIVVVDKKNEGVSKTRNMGIKRAKGKWITFIDADDMIAHNYVSTLLSKADNRDVCFVKECKERAKLENKEDFKSKSLNRNDFMLYERGLLNKYILDSEIHLTSSCARLIKMSFIRRYNIYFPENLSKSEDAVFNMKLYHYAEAGVLYDATLYYYRQNPKSATHKYCDEIIKTYMQHLSYVQEFYLEENYPVQEQIYLAELYVRAVFDFIYCVVGDYCHIDNKKKYKQRKEEFNIAVQNNVFKEAFERINLEKLSIQERIVIYLIKKKCFGILNFVIRMITMIGK